MARQKASASVRDCIREASVWCPSDAPVIGCHRTGEECEQRKAPDATCTFSIRPEPVELAMAVDPPPPPAPTPPPAPPVPASPSASDRDGDGVPDTDDFCPEVPATAGTLTAGCPADMPASQSCFSYRDKTLTSCTFTIDCEQSRTSTLKRLRIPESDATACTHASGGIYCYQVAKGPEKLGVAECTDTMNACKFSEAGVKTSGTIVAHCTFWPGS